MAEHLPVVAESTSRGSSVDGRSAVATKDTAARSVSIGDISALNSRTESLRCASSRGAPHRLVQRDHAHGSVEIHGRSIFGLLILSVICDRMPLKI